MREPGHPISTPPQRWIMHVDMDAFYASIEQMDHPELRGKPVVVGMGVRGVVSAASYEVRAFGVRSAMPLGEARRRCPHAVFTPVRMERYKEVSCLVQAALADFSPLVEQASVDEAYLDATGLERLFGPVDNLARAIREAVAGATGGLSCSVGLAPIKFLAKIASDLNKPGGISIITPEAMPAFLRDLPVHKIPGVGKRFLDDLQPLNVKTGADVLRFSADFWERRFGKAGLQLLHRAQGLDPRGVEPFTPAKSESAEHTFDEDVSDPELLKTWLFRQSDRVGRSLRRHGLKGRVITLKWKYADFRQFTRRVSLDDPTCATQTIYETACALFDAAQPLNGKVRLIGVGVSGFDSGAPRQLTLPLFAPPPTAPLAPAAHETEEKRTRLDATLDTLRERFGTAAVVPGRLLKP